MGEHSGTGTPAARSMLVSGTVDDFIDWLEMYAAVNQTGYVARWKIVDEETGVVYFNQAVNRDEQSVAGWLHFEIRAISEDVTEVILEEHRGFTPEIYEAYASELIDAIQHTY